MIADAPIATLIEYDVVVAAGVAENVKEEPVGGESAVLPAAVSVKSVVKPVMEPLALETDIVHVAEPPNRKGLAMVHDNKEAVVGTPYTTKFSDPSTINEDP